MVLPSHLCRLLPSLGLWVVRFSSTTLCSVAGEMPTVQFAPIFTKPEAQHLKVIRGLKGTGLALVRCNKNVDKKLNIVVELDFYPHPSYHKC